MAVPAAYHNYVTKELGSSTCAGMMLKFSGSKAGVNWNNMWLHQWWQKISMSIYKSFKMCE